MRADCFQRICTLICISFIHSASSQLGLGDTSDQDEPTYVDSLRGIGIKQIACGSGHTVVLTSDGYVESSRVVVVVYGERFII
jgi:alpha-tubulin suppressor-like RCC1 family protein